MQASAAELCFGSCPRSTTCAPAGTRTLPDLPMAVMRLPVMITVRSGSKARPGSVAVTSMTVTWFRTREGSSDGVEPAPGLAEGEAERVAVIRHRATEIIHEELGGQRCQTRLCSESHDVQQIAGGSIQHGVETPFFIESS